MSVTTDNPFPGLRSFDYEEHHLFFGREKHIQDLLKKLEQHHFVAVVGSSGSGKSSLIRAGLLPAIHRGKLETDGSNWLIASMKPGNTPLENLAAALTVKGVFGEEQGKQQRILSLISESSLGLIQAVRPELKDGRRLLILIDQFEELFRFADDNATHRQNESNAFAQLIIDSVRQRDLPIYVVLTLRSDFLGDCVRFEGLPEAINDGHYLVPRLNKEQNKLAITGPVDYAKGKISPRLVQRVINELGDDQDQLPVLQHALMRTWDCWKKSADPGEPMDLRHYDMIGGMQNALSEHADEAFHELNSEKQQKGIELVFKCLTVKTGDNRGVRRPTSAASLLAITGMSLSELEQILLPFRKSGRTFILPPAEQAISMSTIFDISHESLMRGWDRLSNWVDEEMESAEMYQRLCMSAQLAGEGRAALWRDPELQLALDWKTRNKPNEAWSLQYNQLYKTSMDFLEASRIERDREAERKKKRTAAVRAAVITFLVVVSGLTTWALMQTKTATENFQVAEQKTREALNQKALAEKAKEMALDASRQALDAKSYAELQSNIAGEQKKLAENQKAKAEQEALRAMTQEQEALRQKQLAEQKSKEAFEQKQKAETSQSEATRLRLLSISQNIAFKSIQQKEDVQLAALLAQQAYLLAKNNGGNLDDPQLYNAVYTAAQKIDPTFKVEKVKASSDVSGMEAVGSNISLLFADGNYKRYVAPEFKTTLESKIAALPSSVNTAFLVAAGNFAAFGLEDFSAVIYDLRNPSQNKVLSGHKGLIRAVAISDDGTLIATGARDSTVIIWRNYGLSSKVSFSSRIKSLALGPDGNRLYVGCEDGSVYLYSFNDQEKQLFTSSNGNRVQSLVVSPGGKTVVAGYSNGTIQVLNAKGNLIRALNETGSVDHLRIDEEHDLMVTATASRIIHIYRLSDLNQKPVEIKCPSAITSMVVSNGKFVQVACSDRMLRSYPIETGWFEKVLSAGIKRDLTKDEWNVYIGSDVPYKN